MESSERTPGVHGTFSRGPWWIQIYTYTFYALDFWQKVDLLKKKYALSTKKILKTFIPTIQYACIKRVHKIF